MSFKRSATSDLKNDDVKKRVIEISDTAKLDANHIVYQKLVEGDKQFMDIVALVDGRITLQLLYIRASNTSEITYQELLESILLFSDDTEI